MGTPGELSDRPVAQRVALLTLAHLTRRDRVPAHAGDVVRTTRSRLDEANIDALGRVGEAGLSRALNRLEADGLVETTNGEASPVGKGRPAYRLVVDVAAVEGLATDDQLAGFVEPTDD